MSPSGTWTGGRSAAYWRGAIPGTLIGSRLATRTPDFVLRPTLATVLLATVLLATVLLATVLLATGLKTLISA